MKTLKAIGFLVLILSSFVIFFIIVPKVYFLIYSNDPFSSLPLFKEYKILKKLTNYYLGISVPTFIIISIYSISRLFYLDSKKKTSP